ncbi:MAG: TMEM43 family protein [Caldilineaceae bacterium]
MFKSSGCLGSVLFRVGVGALLFIGAVYLLWTNEGRVDFGRVAKDAVILSPESVDSAAQGKLVAVSGQLRSDEPLGDAPYLQPGSYVVLNREVEMYAWIERRREGAEGSSGSSSGDKAPNDYEYERGWTDSPQDSSKFAVPADHENPPLTVESTKKTVATVKIGAYTLDARSLTMPPSRELILDDGIVMPDPNRYAEGKYLFEGDGLLEEPSVGDLRISYKAVDEGLDVTAFGQLADNRIAPYVHRRGDTLYRAFASGPEAAIEQMGNEYRALLWGMRFFGTLLMWLSFLLASSPLTQVLSVIPLVGGLGRMAVRLVLLALAVILSVTIMIISFVAHSPIILILLLLVIGGGVYWWYRQREPVRNPIPG